MQDKLRKSGIEIIGDIPWATHFCQFYQTRQDLIDTLVPYFKAGLENNEFCIWLTAEPLTAAEARESLEKAIPDFSGYAQKGQIEIVPYRQWYIQVGSFNSERALGSWLEKLRQALSAGFDGLRLTGNTFWLMKKDWKNFAEYEKALNYIIGNRKMLMLCTYCLDKCGAADIVDVVSNHEFALIKQERQWELIENSERHNAEEALKQAMEDLKRHDAETSALLKSLESSEQRYRNLFESMDEGFALCEMIYNEAGKPIDFRYLDINPSFAKLTGLPAEQVVGRTVKEVIPSIEPYWIETYNHIVQSGKSERIDNGVAELNKHFELFAWRSGEGRFAVVFNDVTERKIAETKLRETTEYLENLFNYANAPIIVWDPSFRITRFNPAFENLTGHKAQEVMGKELDVLFPPDRRAESMSRIKRTLAGERFETVEIPIQHQDGSIRTVLWNSANVYASDGKTLVSTIAQGQEITRRKKAEDALREREAEISAILDSAPMLMLLVDSDRRVVKSNRAAAQFANRDINDMIGLRAGEALKCLHSLDDPSGCGFGPVCPECLIRQTLIDTLETGKSHYQVEWRLPFVRDNKSEELTFFLYTMLLNVPQKRALIFIQDITDLKRSEDMIRRLNENLTRRALELEAANKELEAFSYSVSHDLRAPLRSMDGFSQAILEDYANKLDDQGKQYLQYIRSSSQLMARLIDDILDLSRITRREVHLERVDLSDLATEVAQELKKSQPERHVEFVIALGLKADGDKLLLKLVFQNLLGNAFKFTGKLPQAKIEFGIAECNGEKTFFVRDNGNGFDMAYSDKLFKPFQRLHSEKEFTGTGIGLASVQRIINRLGGRVWAEGKPGKGATFYFTLHNNDSIIDKTRVTYE